MDAGPVEAEPMESGDEVSNVSQSIDADTVVKQGGEPQSMELGDEVSQPMQPSGMGEPPVTPIKEIKPVENTPQNLGALTRHDSTTLKQTYRGQINDLLTNILEIDYDFSKISNIEQIQGLATYLDEKAISTYD